MENLLYIQINPFELKSRQLILGSNYPISTKAFTDIELVV